MPRLEALEDRTTPAVVGSATGGGFGVGTGASATGFDTTALDGLSLATASAVDRAFVAEVGRLSLMQAFLGTVVANQATDPRVRAFGARLAADQFALFQRVSPLVAAAGLSVKLTDLDRNVIAALPTLRGAAFDTQVTALCGFYGLQAFGLAQYGAIFGGPVVRVFAQAQFVPLQIQLQNGFALLPPGLAGATSSVFNSLGGFGPLSVTGLGTTGFNADGAFNPPGTSSGFGPGAPFGTTFNF